MKNQRFKGNTRMAGMRKRKVSVHQAERTAGGGEKAATSWSEGGGVGWGDQGRETKVGDFELARLVEEEIFGLEVAVKYAAGVAKVDTVDETLKVRTSLILWQPATSGNDLEELTTGDEFHNNVDLVAGGEHILQVDHTRVLHRFHHLCSSGCASVKDL